MNSSTLVEHRDVALQRIIDECATGGDGTYRPAFAYWITSLHDRDRAFDRTVARKLKIPHALRLARGLASQNVILETDDRVYSAHDKALLYSPS